MIRELIAQQGGAKVDMSLPIGAAWTIVKEHPWMCLLVLAMVIVAAVIPGGAAVKRRRRRRTSAAGWRAIELGHKSVPPGGELGQFRSVVGLLTPTEAMFHPVLVRACGADRECGPRVMTKVRLADIVHPVSESPTRHADFLRVSQKHVDFVIVAGDRMVPMRVVELDDASHDRMDRASRDRLVDEVLRRAGVPITHVPVERSRDFEWVRQRVGSV